ncbi:hypothetical protein ELH51_33665 (plasmid) [Rhizobium ruizarguesonis]|uniref:hypothetical protein n=1 Tax=Rhizobium ruizarguesonis TaxID=2081791 RepID=UPI00102F9D4A|nr:hypothetical protein [Rhizobium ruizarguesonis]TBB15108.1 hypothetical protein ELH51_33665 [Rhizobium ruizarguesonis]
MDLALQNKKCECGSGKKRRYCCHRQRKGRFVDVNTFSDGKTRYAVTTNILQNLVIRDVRAIERSFEEHFSEDLKRIDPLYSEAAFLFFAATKHDYQTGDDYKDILLGLISSALSTFGAAVSALRSGYPSQSMVLIRQVVETCSTIIHIVIDPDDRAIDDFRNGKYSSSKHLGRAKAAVPIIAELWGFLSNSYVHINKMHSELQRPVPYRKGQTNVNEVFICLRMACWISYISAELAFPTTFTATRYWKVQTIDGKTGVAYDPDDEERNWASNFLNIPEISPGSFEKSASDEGGGKAPSS